MTPTRRELAEFFRLGLFSGLVDAREIRLWADGLIAAGGTPAEPWQIDLATAADSENFPELLLRVPGIALGSVPALLLLGRMYLRLRQGALAGPVLASRLYVLLHEGVLPAELTDDIHRIEQAFRSAPSPRLEGGAEPQRLLEEFLGRFSGFAESALRVS